MIKGKATLQNIISPDMVEVCEVIEEWQYETSPVVMKDFVNDEHEDSFRKYLVKKWYKSNWWSKININRDWK